MNPGEMDEIFAEIAMEKGYVTPEQIDTAVEDRKILAERGIEQELADILESKDLLTSEQRQEITRLVRIQTGEARVIGEFEIVSKLGSGGMGVVYRARSRRTGRWVALKVLPPSLAADTAFFGRFQRETQILQRLQHPNVVACVDAGFDEKRKLNYCAMELVEGRTLSERIRSEGFIPEREALIICMQIAQALQHADFHGLVHRDIKPANIMLASDGTAKLLDMGLARDSRQQDGSVTVDGVFVGSPFYASPEQVRGERDVDIRSDIYSLGAALYHLVTGKPPFEGASSADILGKHLNQEPPPAHQANPGVSENTSLLIRKMMAKDRAGRYQNPRNLLADIGVVLQGRPPKGEGAPATNAVTESPPPAESAAASSGVRSARRPGTRRSGRITTRSGMRPVKASPPHGGLPLLVAVLGLAALSVTGYFILTAGDTPAPRRRSTSPAHKAPVTPKEPFETHSTGRPAPVPAPVEKDPSPVYQPEVTLSTGPSRTPAVHRPAAMSGPDETGRYVLVDFESPVEYTSKYGQPAEASPDAAHSGRNGMKVKVAPGMNNHQASRIIIELPEVMDFTKARGIELYVRAEGSGGNRAEVGFGLSNGDIFERGNNSGGGWLFYYQDGGWERHQFDFPGSDQLRIVREIHVYFNHMAKDGPFTFCVDDIALTGYGEGPLPAETPAATFSSYAALPRPRVSEPVKKYSLTAGDREVLFAATFDDGHDGFFGGRHVTDSTYKGTPGAFKAYYFGDEKWFPCKMATETHVHSPKGLTELFRLEPGTRIRVAAFVDGADFMNVQFWDMDKGGNYYIRKTGLKQGEWLVVEVDPLEAVPTANDDTFPGVGDGIKALGFYSGYKGRDCTFIIDEISVVSGKTAEARPAPPGPAPAVSNPLQEPPRVALLDEFDRLAGEGRYEEAERRMRDAGFREAASVAAALAQRRSLLITTVRKLVDRTVAIATSRGLKRGKVISAGDDGIKMVTARKIPGMGEMQMSYKISWGDLTPEAGERFAKGWDPQGRDGAMAKAFAALEADDEETAKAALANAGDHPLAPIVRKRLGIAPPAQPEETTPEAPTVEPGWKVLFDGTGTEGWTIDPGGTVEKGELVSPEQGGGFYYPAYWENFELEFELFFQSSKPTVIAMVSVNQHSHAGVDNRLRMAFHGDGDMHFKDNPDALPLWKSGVGAFPPRKWMKIRIRVTSDTAAIWLDGKKMAGVDVSAVPVKRGGVYLYSRPDFMVRYRNVRVRVLDGN